MAANPEHPYNKVGLTHIAASLDDLQRHCAAQGLPLFRQERNHQRLTPSAPSKPPGSPRHLRLRDRCAGPDAILLATLEGFRDFHPELAVANLATHTRFAHCRILTGELRLPQLAEFSRNPHEFRSADIARLFDKQGNGQRDLLTDLARGSAAWCRRAVSRAAITWCCPPACRWGWSARAWRSWSSAPAASSRRWPPCRRH